MKIAIGCDHGGINLKPYVVKTLNELNYECVDFGTFFAGESVDYPDYALKVAEAVKNKEADKGILMCGTGIGMTIAANKVKGVRCANVYDTNTAELCVKHNNANVISLGGRTLAVESIDGILRAYFGAEHEGGRHAERLKKVKKIEDKN